MGLLRLALAIAVAFAAADASATEGTRVYRPAMMSLQALQDLNPEKTKEACDKCVAGQEAAVEKEAELSQANEAVVKALEALEAADEKAKDALEDQKKALDAYNAADTNLKDANEESRAAKDETETAEAAQKVEKEAAAAALTEAQGGCVGFNLPELNKAVDAAKVGPAVFVQAPKYPQNAMVSSYCPEGKKYVKHACGTNAEEYIKGTVSAPQWGPYDHDWLLSNRYGIRTARSEQHCHCCCNCNNVWIECQ